jgi:hypothetical protein
MAEEPQEPQANEFQLPEEFQGKNTQELYNQIMAERDRVSELSQYESVARQLDQYGGLDSLVSGYNTLYQRYANDNAQAQTPQQPQQAPQQQAPQPTADAYADWDLLSPQEQANRLSQNVSQQVAQAAQQYIESAAQNYATQFQQAQEAMQKQQRTEWDIYRRALEVKQKNPNVDTEKLLQEMVGMATGDTSNLMDLALKNLTAETDAETRAQQLYEAKLADLEQERQNEAMQVLSGNPNGPVRISKREEGPKTAREENALIAKKLVEDGTLSPGHFL